MPITDATTHSTHVQTLRDILAAQTCLTASSVFDPMSARLARSIGSPVGVLGGSAASQTILGAPDIVLMTASELIEQARRICRTQCVHLIVDADHGYGNALNVMRTIQDLQAAGVAATCLEDTLLPRQFGSTGAQELLSLEEGRKKTMAALQARGQGPMLILGRTNAITSHGLQEAIPRLLAYEDLGVDALFVPYLTRRQDLEDIARKVQRPLILAGSHPTLYDADLLRDCGVKIWMWGHQPMLVALAALHQAMRAAQAGTPPAQLLNNLDPELLSIVTDEKHYDALTNAFLK